MNAELCKRAAEKVGNPNVLVNLISRRVRQLNSGGGGLSRPLITDVGNLGAADIALREMLEDKIGWEMPEPVELVRPQPKKRKKTLDSSAIYDLRFTIYESLLSSFQISSRKSLNLQI